MQKLLWTVRAAPHLALWASLYVTGAVICFAQLTGLMHPARPVRTTWLMLGFAFSTAAAVYLLDRVKVRDAWLDPADRLAHPARFEFLAAHSGTARALMLLMAIVSAGTGSLLSPIGPAFTILACGGVLAYAGRPRGARARIKDIFLLKNGFVAAGITAFAVVVCVLGSGRGTSLDGVRGLADERWAPLAFAAAQLFVRVFADAAVCDLDDEHADRSYRTATLPTHLGRIRAWNLAAGMRLVIGIVLLIMPVGPGAACRAWGVVTIVSTLALRLWNPRRVREAVDGRLAAEAVVVWIALALVKQPA